MRLILLEVLMTLVIGLLIWHYANIETWAVSPTTNGQWRSSYRHCDWAGCTTAYSSPMTLDEAEWWARTKGGTDAN